MTTIDLNSDLGESFGNYTFGDDAAVLESVSSANVACGFHAGDPRGIRITCRAAVASGTTIGAHPGYHDLAGFGRRFIDMDPGELTDEVIYQIGALQAIARSAGGEVRYVKPHGGLYNTIAVHEGQARAVVRAMTELAPELPLMVLPGSVVERVAREAGLRTVAEAFADRAYVADGTLVKRGTSGAILDPDAAVAQAVRFATEGRVRAIDGTELEIAPDSICLHGDNPAAIELARRIRAGLEAAGVRIESFA
ncbi:LamB/YcsF family protein [Leucobacter sp. CSA2]|uniref:5-oxoprolinase subunit A n=1 Tax=Leucobacter edaphi TaxID=2796472 RepID=A0A934UWF8_9MICO|nr:5-oxoprolinase subunit PxpA [Leucobacter edaphi]MBK0420920.1 LamB/YcsF family protein [Leucobacter edaphi]